MLEDEDGADPARGVIVIGAVKCFGALGPRVRALFSQEARVQAMGVHEARAVLTKHFQFGERAEDVSAML
jgi:hypothetical protein